MTNDGEQIEVHAEGYKRFIGWIKFSMIAVAVITVVVLMLITR